MIVMSILQKIPGFFSFPLTLHNEIVHRILIHPCVFTEFKKRYRHAGGFAQCITYYLQQLTPKSFRFSIDHRYIFGINYQAGRPLEVVPTHQVVHILIQGAVYTPCFQQIIEVYAVWYRKAEVGVF